jgi:hypothetical protein
MSQAITINEMQIRIMKPQRNIVPTRPIDEFVSAERNITNELHGAGVKKWEGTHRAIDDATTRTMYVYSLYLENGLY